MVEDKYKTVLEHFKLYYPNIYNDSVDWWASGRMAVTVKLRDGSVFEYDRFDNSLRRVRTGECMEDETAIAKELGHNLQKFIRLSGMTQTEIAEKLGITNAMLSRYVHGTSLPNSAKIFKIARLLGCTVDELYSATYSE